MVRMAVAQRRTLLVAAALRVVAEHGIEGASTRAIVAEAGMSLASFHYAFESRQELLETLMAEVLAVEEQAVLPEVGSSASMTELVATSLTRYLDHLRSDPTREQAMLELTRYALRTGNPMARHQYEQYKRIALASLELVADATGRSWSVPIDTAAALLVALTDGLTLTWLVSRDDQTAQAVIAAAARAVAALAEPQSGQEVA